MNQPMIHVTPTAAAKLKELRGEPAPLVRLYIKGRTCCSYRYGLAFADPADSGGDQSMLGETDGVRLIGDAQTATACDGGYVDYVETEAGAGFTVRGAGGDTGCTCGSHAAG